MKTRTQPGLIKLSSVEQREANHGQAGKEEPRREQRDAGSRSKASPQAQGSEDMFLDISLICCAYRLLACRRTHLTNHLDDGGNRGLRLFSFNTVSAVLRKQLLTIGG